MKGLERPTHFLSSVSVEPEIVEAHSASRHWAAPLRRAPSKNVPLFLFITGLTALAVAIHGYHPYAEDGGLYLAGIKKLLHPSLYSFGTGFATVDLRFSLFASIVATIVRISSLSLTQAIFLIHLGTIWMTLYASWLIADRCYWSREACYGATSLLATWLTMPIAGTSLLLMDPYVSARSVSTPCAMLAIAAALDVRRSLDERRSIPWKSVIPVTASLLVAFACHALMAAYALGCLLLLACNCFYDRTKRIVATLGVCLASIVVAFCLELQSSFRPPLYARAAHTREYWFLANWHWYELLGLVAPLLVLALMTKREQRRRVDNVSLLVSMCIAAGVTGILVAVLFAHLDSHSFAVARLQPLRIFQIIYVLMIVALGATLGEHVLKRHWLRWATMFVGLSSIMLFVQRDTFPASGHMEFPWSAPMNSWEEGFEWIQSNTPEDTVFAMDAHYSLMHGEDAQNFRAIAERSPLPDYEKDGGLASIAPDLTYEWVDGERAQLGLDAATDAQRIAMLHGSAAQWIVLSRDAVTQFYCPYTNSAMKVCRLPGN